MLKQRTRRRRDGLCLAGTRRKEQGQSLVEFALVLPLLAVVLFAILEFGLIITNQIELTNAVGDGARTASLTATNGSAAVTETQQSAGRLTSCSLSTPTAKYDDPTPQQVTVTAQCTYTPLTPLGSLIALIGGSLNTSSPLCPKSTLCARTSMRVQ